MNQRIEVRSIVRKDDRLLLLKRATGQEYALESLNYPGVISVDSEQPEEAVARYIHETTGLESEHFLSVGCAYLCRQDQPGIHTRRYSLRRECVR